MKIYCLSYNYSKSSTEEKKSLVFSDSNSLQAFYKKLQESTLHHDFLVLNTCNRLEIYYLAKQNFNSEIKNILFGEVETQLFALELEAKVAMKHLFEVSIGAKSQVLGDNQVIYQLKEAYKYANEFTQLSGLFHQLLHIVFRLNKRVVNETNFKEGSVSIASSAVQLLGGLVKKNKQAPILLVGTGQNGQDTLKNLLNSGYQNIFITNRTDEKAEELANKMGVSFFPFAELSSKIDNFKAVILSVHTSSYLIDKNFFDWQRIRYDFTYFLDLGALPSIDLEIEQNPCFEIYDLSYMTERNEESLASRNLALQSVAGIIEEECLAFEQNFIFKNLFDEFYKLDIQSISELSACEFLDDFLTKNVSIELSDNEKKSIKNKFLTVLEKTFANQ